MSSPINLHDKVFRHMDRLIDIVEDRITYPVTWELDPTNRCNHYCVGGYAKGAGGRTNNDHLTLKQAKYYVDQVVELNAKAINLTGGGDPMFNKITPKLIEYIRNKGLDVGMITNGSLFNDKSIKTVVDNCSWVRVSLDAGTPKTHAFIRKVPEKQFGQILSNIRNLSEQKTTCKVGTALLTSPETMGDIVEFTRVSKECGVDYVQIRPFHEDFTIPLRINECLAMQDENFKVLYSENKYHAGYKKQYTRCEAQALSGVINVHKLYLCCHFRGVDKYELGDLREQSLKEIWHSQHRQDIINNLDFKDCIPHCRLDLVNRTIDDLKTPVPDENFI